MQQRRALELVIDEEVNRLPVNYRRPVVLCYLQGKGYEEAAGKLGCRKSIVAVRLARAGALLQRRLARRGVFLTGGLLSTMLMEQLRSMNVSPALLQSTLKAARLLVAGKSAARAAGGPTARLSAKTPETVRWTKPEIEAMAGKRSKYRGPPT